MLNSFPLSSFDAAAELPTYIAVMLTFGPIVIGMSLLFYFTRHKRSWQKGVFPRKLKYTPDNILEAYLALGARLIRFDQSRTMIRVTYINDYFNRYFRLANYNFSDSLVFSMRNPIKTETVCDWFNLHLEKDEEKAQIVYFITGLALIRGTLSPKEHTLLKQINDNLKLAPEILQRILAIHISHKANQRYEEPRQRTRGSSRKKPVADRLVYCRILGVKETDDDVTIKKAYRKLVKKLHPDVFVNASESQLKMAEEKFKEVQRAYDFLIKDKQKDFKT
jgi:DnaJ-domain-containing protein 1